MSAATPAPRPSGIRKLGTQSLHAQTMLDDYAKRTHYATRSEASGAFKRAAPFLGHGPQILALVDYLISLTQPQDWQGGPITVWPCNGRLCHIFGAVERTIQVQLTALHEARLIAFIDSPSRRRYGLRHEDGRIRIAYGIDLRPLAARYEEFCATAAAAEATYQQRITLHRLASIARQKTEQICSAAIALDPYDPDPWHDMSMQAKHLGNAAHEATDSARIENLLAQLDQLHASCLTAFQDLTSSSAEHTPQTQDSPYRESQDSPLTSTNLPALKEKPCGASRDSSRQTEPDSAPIRPPDPGSQQTPDPNTTTRPGTPPQRVHAHLRAYRINPSMLAEASPPLAEALWTVSAQEETGWRDIVDSANALLPDLGISQNAWGQACHEISREGAAVAVAVIAAKHRQGSVKKPGGYLRWMTREIVAGGVLDLGPKVYGLRSPHSK